MSLTVIEENKELSRTRYSPFPVNLSLMVLMLIALFLIFSAALISDCETKFHNNLKQLTVLHVCTINIWGGGQEKNGKIFKLTDGIY
jgi:divalent metal cation (Fe/Co/Zn/Cd) transporter